MAIFHLAAKVVSRKAGQSVVAKAAYNAREELTEERTGEIKDYSRAKGLQFSGIFTPANAPTWAHDRAKLWNAADQAENRKDSTLAREYEISLPHELTNEQRRFLVQDFVRESFTRKGYAVDVAIHAPDREGDERNYHAHILVSDRRLEADGFAADKKERKLKSPERKAELEALREKWERTANRHLERHGHEARIDRRSLKDQGIDREPTEHLGPYATQLERDCEQSERGDINREIEARNTEREQLKEEQREAQQNEQEQGRAASEHTTAPERKPKPTREPSERHESLQPANERSGRFRVVDKETGLESSVSAFAGKALDYVATQAEGFIEGIASLFDGGSTAPRRPAPAEPPRVPKTALQALQERAARERALKNISRSVQRGDELNAADLRTLPPVELERLREGGDDYLMRLVKRHDREREERDRGRERER